MTNILSWIIMIAIIFGITACANSQFFEDGEETPSPPNSTPNEESTIEQKPSLISKCKDSLKECEYIAARKYDLSISLLETKKFTDKEKAEEFYNIWGGPTQFYLRWELRLDNFSITVEDSLPLTLFFLKVKGQLGESPMVIACNKDGELVKYSKIRLSCG